jgi:hypothetical protein
MTSLRLSRAGRVLVIAGVLTVFASLAWAITSDQVTARIRNKINQKWRTSNLKVTVNPFSQTDTSKGRFSAIYVAADSVCIDDVKLTGVRISATDVTLDLNQLTRANQVVTTKRKTGHFVARVSQGDLNKALSHKKNTIQNLKVVLANGTLTFTGTYKFGIGANLRLEGRLETPDHYKVNFVPTKASVNGIPLPAGPLRVVLQRINPLLDFRTVPLNPRVEKIIVSGGSLVMSG